MSPPRPQPSRVHLIAVLAAPFGMRPERLEALVRGTLAPLVETLERRDELRLSLRLGGHLLEATEADHGHLADRLAGLATAGRVELVGGGFYAPILALLPWRDAIGQLEMTAGFLERRTGVRPLGAWLDEGVWEPRLAEVLETAGATWTALDESALRAAAIDGELDGHYVTEHAGRPLAVLPIDRALRHAIAARSAEAMLAVCRRRREALGRPVTLTWAGPAQHLVADADPSALDALLDAVAKSDELRWALPAASVEQSRAHGRVYLGSGVAPELTARTVAPWRLAGWQRRRALLMAAGDDEASAEEWLRGGIWQAFLARYGEIDRMHKRLLEVSRRFAAVERVMRNGGFRAISQLVKPRRALYRGQSGAAFGWGTGAGMHDADLRAAVHAALIEAEAAAEALVRDEGAFLEVSLRDVHAELETAILLRSRAFRIVVRPNVGGTLAALEYLPGGVALHDVLTRRVEVGQPDDVEADGHERAWLHDRFLAPDEKPGAWMRDAGELGDLLSRRYRTVGVDTRGRGADERVDVLLATDGVLRQPDGAVAVSLVKTLGMRASDEKLSVRWALEFERPLTHAVDFAVECNLAFATSSPAEGTLDVPGVGLVAADASARSTAPGPLGFTLDRAGVTGAIRADREVVYEVEPVYTVAMPLDGPTRRAFQGAAVLLRFALAPGCRVARVGVEISVGPIARELGDVGAA